MKQPHRLNKFFSLEKSCLNARGIQKMSGILIHSSLFIWFCFLNKRSMLHEIKLSNKDSESALGENSSYSVLSDCETPCLTVLWMTEVNITPSTIRQIHIRRNLLKTIKIPPLTQDNPKSQSATM